MAKDDLLQRAVDKIKAERGETVPIQKIPLDEAVSKVKGEPIQENIWEAPAFFQKQPFKSLVGTGQELAEFATGIPRLFGIDVPTPPKAVETGFGEKAGAGIIEYLLGGAGAKAIPAVGRGIEAIGKIPAVGRALAAPITQRAAGAAAMGAIEDPEHPGRGAALGAAISPAVELGFKAPQKAVDLMTKGKWSPFHQMMMPHIKREFNEFLDNTGRKLGLTGEHDVDKALFDNINSKYNVVTNEASGLYDKASDAFKGVKLPVYWKEGLRGRTLPLIKDIKDTYKKATDSFGIKIHKSMKTLEEKIDDPVVFRQKIHQMQREAVRSGNHDLIESLQGVETNFDKNLNNLAGKTKDVGLSNALDSLKKADTYFKDNVVPFRNRTSVKLEAGKRKTVPTKFFQAHSKDSSKNLSKAITSDIQDLEHLSKTIPESKDYLTFSNLKEGYNNPEKFIENYSALSKEQKDSLFSKDQIARFDKFKKIYNKNPRAFRDPDLLDKRIIPGIATATGLSAAAFPSASTIGMATGALGGLSGLKGLAAIPAAREAYIGGKSIIPTEKEGVRDMVIGALLGQTKD